MKKTTIARLESQFKSIDPGFPVYMDFKGTRWTATHVSCVAPMPHRRQKKSPTLLQFDLIAEENLGGIKVAIKDHVTIPLSPEVIFKRKVLSVDPRLRSEVQKFAFRDKAGNNRTLFLIPHLPN